MLNINNKSDIPEMMKCHRTKDMINLITYFKDLSPIRNLTLVTSLSDYYENYKFCKNFPGVRNDTLITKPPMKSIEAKGINPNIPEILEKVKKIDPDGVIALFDLCHLPSERYERYAGIAIGISLGKCVLIEAVGKGFDGREISKNISCHERYYIPWFELRRCNIENFKNYQTFLTSNEDYQISKENRINYLTNTLKLPLDTVLKNVPNVYTEIPSFIWLDVIKNCLKKLENMEEELSSAGFREFSIHDHTERKQFLPWQMFDETRYPRIKKK